MRSAIGSRFRNLGRLIGNTPMLAMQFCFRGAERVIYPGISDEFIPAILKLDEPDPAIDVSDGDSILMAQKLASDLGLAVGISSGDNFLGALEAQNRLDADAVVVTVFADHNKKHLTTDILREEPVRGGYLSPEVELTGFEAMKRVCNKLLRVSE